MSLTHLLYPGSYVRTLLKEADLVFLLPLEPKMGTYFKHSFKYSYLSQLFPLLALSLVCMPLFFAVSPGYKSSILQIKRITASIIFMLLSFINVIRHSMA
jgi:predicted ABC-type exoprotein transport system permease subunit